MAAMLQFALARGGVCGDHTTHTRVGAFREMMDVWEGGETQEVGVGERAAHLLCGKGGADNQWCFLR